MWFAIQEKIHYTVTSRGRLGRGWVIARLVSVLVMPSDMMNYSNGHSLDVFRPVSERPSMLM